MGVCRPLGDEVWYAYGRVPKSFLNLFAARKAFIYVLEIFAQLMAAIVFAKRLPQLWIAWIDNTAGEAPLIKRYGKDPAGSWRPSGLWRRAKHGHPSSKGCLRPPRFPTQRPEAIYDTPGRWVGVNFRYFRSPLTSSSPSWQRPPTTSTTPIPARSTTCSVSATS